MKDLSIDKLYWVSSKYAIALLLSLALIVLYVIIRYNFFLAHTLIEFYTVFIALTIFVLAWNTRKFSDNRYILFLGIGYLFVGMLDLLHAISYREMGIFSGNDGNLPVQLWIAARYLESITLLLAPAFISRKLRVGRAFSLYQIIFVLVLLVIFYWRIFPDCITDGSGYTLFKTASEYIVSFIIVCAGWYLYRNRKRIDYSVYKLLISAMAVTIFAELVSTLYSDVYGITNYISHAGKLVSFYLLFSAIVATGLQKPYSVLFKDLRDSKDELMKSEEKLKQILDSATEGIIVTDVAGKIIDVNHFVRVLTGYHGKKHLVGKYFSELFVSADTIKAMKTVQTLAGRKKTGYFCVRLVKADGTEFMAELRAGMLHGTEGNAEGFVIMVSDITEREMLEKRRRDIERKAQMENRLATVGRLASGMAHEINNPLTSIIGNVQLLLQQEVPGHIAEDLETINTAAKRVANIVMKLQVFAREQDSERSLIDVNDAINTLVSMLESQLMAHDIHVTKNLDGNLPEIYSIKGQLLQVFLNIIMNTEQAMYGNSKKGNLNISTYADNDKVYIVFQDDGPGIAPENIDKIFDPFFTTRGIGRAMGLGLSISREIVVTLGGDITVQSEHGQGTTVKIELPYTSLEYAREGAHEQSISYS